MNRRKTSRPAAASDLEMRVSRLESTADSDRPPAAGRQTRGRYRVLAGDVVDEAGVVEYDHLDSAEQAEDLCRLMNEGVDPAWDVLGEAYEELLARRREKRPGSTP